MSIHLRRPSESDIDQLLARCSSEPVSYEPIGVSLTDDDPPSGFVRRTWTTRLPAIDAYAQAAAALSNWEVHTRSGLTVRSDGPPAPGTNVAMIAPLPVGYAEVTCRVVAVVDEPDRFGFAYGTLPVHPECGEEAFIVSRAGPNIRFDVTAVSRHVDPLARLVPWLTNRLQDSAAERYLRAMETLSAR